ncbi:MAG: isoleucine--tRNA ligase [Nitrososphaeria archaeon]|nr:isoleucine--tRNA ligase [Nitrososphaeria archaeon]
MLDPVYKPKEIEDEIRVFWEKNCIREKVEMDPSKVETVGYVEGPPTLNGEPHIGHLRGRVYKDLWFRFTTLSGKRVIFRGGWDTQGLPVELQAAKELGIIGGKQELLKYGMEKIVEKAKEMIKYYHKFWISADNLMGMMMDHDKDYWTYKDEYIEREWQILKVAWEDGLLGESFRVVGYCPSCQTALSHSEVSSEYEMLEDPSLYYKVRLKNYPNRFIVLWTTMPFTVVTDIMVAVHPNSTYSIVEVNGEEWIIASNRVNDFMKEVGIEDYRMRGEILGETLKGERYEYPLEEEVPKQALLDREYNAHVIVLDESVDINTGTGIVHMAPSNGEIDFEIARREGLPIFNPFDDSVCFTKDAGKYAGIFARDADNIVIEDLRRKGLLVHVSKIVHEYPTCWRSHHRLVWLARREYFYWVDKIGDRALKAAEKVEYFFDAPKNRFLNIIREMKPWCISRERVWGTPLPIWVCSSCGEKIGLFSRKEIIENAIELPDGENFELHRPWIDRVVVRCKKCGGKAYREPFVLDTWHNSGASPYAAFTDEEYRKYVPVEFLTEGIDQTRGWAYSLLILSVILTRGPNSPYKAFLFQGHILGPDESKMSKSLGNIIDANKTLMENSVDAVRFYLVWKNSPIATLIFKPDEIYGRPFQVLNTLYHLHVYLQQNSVLDNFDDSICNIDWCISNNLLTFFDKWILSRCQRLIESVSKYYTCAEYNEAARELERFIIEELSQKYVPFVRRELWTDDPKTLKRRLAIYAVLSYCLKNVDILLHPISPFITEKLYLECFKERKESILLERLPVQKRELIDDGLESKFKLIDEMVSETNSLRMKAKLKRRWPVERAVFVFDKMVEFNEEEFFILRELCNVKQLDIYSNLNLAPVKLDMKPILQNLGKRFKRDLPLLLDNLNKVDKSALAQELKEKNEAKIEFDGKVFSLYRDDFEYLIVPEKGYMMQDTSFGKVILKVERNEELIREGLLRDIARRIQAYRKELGLNPAQVVKSILVWTDDEEVSETIKIYLNELKFLVRAENVILAKDAKEDWKMIEFDDKSLALKIEL